MDGRDFCELKLHCKRQELEDWFAKAVKEMGCTEQQCELHVHWQAEDFFQHDDDEVENGSMNDKTFG